MNFNLRDIAIIRKLMNKGYNKKEASYALLINGWRPLKFSRAWDHYLKYHEGSFYRGIDWNKYERAR